MNLMQITIEHKREVINMSYQQCTRCLMDTVADPNITFDAQGYCNYCMEALAQINTTTYFPNEEGQRRLGAMLERVKTAGKGKDYDCIMGISGGLDSSYLAYLGHQWGLRILAIHIDDGYDTEISKENIRKLCGATKIELHTVTPDVRQYDALTRAYMEAGVPDLAVPQDNILFACLYQEVKKHKIPFFLNGGNFALECILQHGHSHSAMDLTNLRDIHKRFGTEKIDRLPFTSAYRKYFLMKTGKLINIRPLNYIDYNRDRAFQELKDFCGFEYYGRKHLENILTAFIQLYWLPKKFHSDKRVSHLSSMIVSGQMTREEALRELSEPLYDEDMMEGYISIIKQRLKLSDEDFDRLMAAPPHEHTDYKVDKIDPILRKILN